MPTAPSTLQVDILILGGGVAGLWMLNRAVSAGFNAILLERDALGSGQTIASQGMIHGGVKYTLGGALSGASEAISDMPDLWRDCLAGKGDIDLRGTRLLSDHFYMWSSQGAVSRLAAFFASKALRGRVDALAPDDFPAIFRHPGFKGLVYKLVDAVIDTPSLLGALRDPQADRILPLQGEFQLQRQGDRVVLHCQQAGEKVVIESQVCVLAAGQGNGDMLAQLAVATPAMQVRPLHQVMVKHRHRDAVLYAHCTGHDSKPRLTVSTHFEGDELIWYLGGQLAEDGVQQTPAELMTTAKQELIALFPWYDWSDAEWATHRVVRAEPRQPGLVRPDKAWLSACENLPGCLVAWPTKLTLAPNLGQLLIDHLGNQGVRPQHAGAVPTHWPRLSRIADAPWHNVMWERH
jgi:glycine/D-amino acid oxidase-like deaminating enzyme